ncbi:hypothetical protein KAR91_13465 [Candidatus Pacearchaeota archaeon]|nr:hypothetical protein [Candidatus Pacearchaeota archaeon]
MMKDIVNKIATFIIKIVNFNGSFIFRNNYYSYFIHERSWATERVVEIPIILKYIDKNKRTLEVGNVLSQFVNTKWDIVDKFEFGKDIINEDIIDFKPNEKYDLIISISTLEHIGFNEDVGGGEKPEDNIDKGKIIDAINNLKTNCLKPNGKIVATVPLGYNKKMDETLFNNELGFDKLYFIKRISKRNFWKEIEKTDVVEPQYGHPFPCANYICVGIYEDIGDNIQ